MEVICREHGSFWVRPNNHMYAGTGCPECAKRVRQAKARQRADRRKLLEAAPIRAAEIALVLETLGRVMISEGMEDLAGHNASWFSDAAEVVELLAEVAGSN